MTSPREKLYKQSKREAQSEHPGKSSSSSASPILDTRRLISFQKEYAAAQDYSAKYRVLRVRWLEVGNNEMMPDFCQEVLSALIGYRYMKAAYNEAGLMMPDRAAKNLYALEKNDIKGLSPNMARMMAILTASSTNRGEEGMAKKASSKKETVLGVSQFYLEVFENQAKAKLTDVQIVDIIKGKTGNEPTLKNVASYRCMYNAGNLQGQSKCPAEKVKAVRISKAKPKKPMSEETKAKLKAYTAAKKAKAAKKK